MGQQMRIRTALVTSRSAPAHDRAIRTLMSWDVEVDEAMFLGGLEKGPFLQVFDPDFYFDDQMTHLNSATRAGAPSGHVDAGVVNEPTIAAAAARAADVDAGTVNKLLRPRRTERA
jgi:5'-nucleotidase